MKTNNVILRPMGEFKVAQRTKDGMFNATELLKQWNLTANQSKSVNHYLENSKTKEFIDAVILDDDQIRNSEKPINQILIKVKGKTKSDGSREVGSVWMHPLLFLDFAMWINPSFKVKVLKFIADQMLKYRNDAGDAYRKMANSVQKIVSSSFMPVAMSNLSKAINYVVFGSHETMMRNKVGEESKQQELFSLEVKLSDLIEDGFIKSYDELMNYLRKKWSEKYTPSLLK
jgi:hypothetical protein